MTGSKRKQECCDGDQETCSPNLVSVDLPLILKGKPGSGLVDLDLDLHCGVYGKTRNVK